MICQFSVENYKSFKGLATLDMQATNIDSNDTNILTDVDGAKFLPLAAIYGPNGGGKSNIIDALHCLSVHVLRPVCAACDQTKCDMKNFNSHPTSPFKLSKESLNKPTKFELYFRTEIAEYRYNLDLKEEKVIFESLSKINIKGNKTFNVFTRDTYAKQNNILSQGLKKYGIENVTETLPWISYFAIINGKLPIINDVISWFHKLNFINYSNPDFEHKVFLVEGKLKDLELKMFKEMDIDIDNFKLEKDNDSNKKEKFLTIHNIDGIKTEFDLSEESNGTIKLFNLLPFVAQCLLDGAILIVDELDSKLHPKLLQYIIELFRNKQSNKHNAQLIFTSQDIATMIPQLFRRDEIWFAAKNYEQASSLYSLAEIKKENGKSPRNDEKYGKQYLEGRYGADPYLRRILNWEEIE